MIDSFIYIFVFILEISFMYCYQKSNNKYVSFLNLSISFLLLFFFLVLRFNTGADYQNYTNSVLNVYKTKNYFVFEIGWAPLLFVMDKLKFPTHFFFVFSGFFTLFFIFKSISKKNAMISICIYLCLGYIESFSVVRQCLAASIYTFYFAKYLTNKKYSVLILGTIISSCFHLSLLVSIIILPISIFINKNHAKWSNMKSILFFLLILTIFTFINFSDLIFTFLEFTPYKVYINMGEALIGETELSLGIGMVLRYLLLFCIVLTSNSKKNVVNEFSKLDLTRYSIIFIELIFFLLSIRIKIFMRLPLVFNSLLCVLFVYKKHKYGKIQKLSMILICFLLYFATVLRSPKNLAGTWDLIPYNSIFNICFRSY